MVALNLSLGDQGWLDEQDCGCPYRGIGWTTRFRAIESFEKLKAAGMTFLDTDVIRILEADLPARFGGGPTDYQLVEEEPSMGDPVSCSWCGPRSARRCRRRHRLVSRPPRTRIRGASASWR